MFTFCMRAAALVAAMLPPLAVAAPLTLSQALDLALQRSETTRSARASLTSASEAARAASQLPDPVLRAGIDNLPVTGGDRLSTTRESMTMKRIGIAQEWISSEKRAARQAAADAIVGREAVSVQAAAAEVRLQTALAFLDAYYAGETLKLTTQSEHHIREELEAAKARKHGCPRLPAAARMCWPPPAPEALPRTSPQKSSSSRAQRGCRLSAGSASLQTGSMKRQSTTSASSTIASVSTCSELSVNR